MKKRHIIPLATIAAILGCRPNDNIPEQHTESDKTELKDTTTSEPPKDAAPWENVLDTTITIPGIPTN